MSEAASSAGVEHAELQPSHAVGFVMSLRAPPFWAWYLGFALLATAVYAVHHYDATQAALAIGSWTGATVAVIAGISLHRPPRAVGWYVIAGSAAVATVYWAAREARLLGNGEAPSADSRTALLGLSACVVLAAALVLLLARRETSYSLLDAGIFAVGLGLVVRLFLWDTYFDASPVSAIGTATLLASALADVVILCLCVRLLRSRPRTAAFWLLLTAAGAWIASDFAVSWATQVGGYAPGSLADLGWLVSPSLLGAAALHPTMRDLFETRRQPAAELGAHYLALLVLASVTAPVLLLTKEGTEDVAAVGAIAAGASLLSLLALARVVGLVSEGSVLRRRLIAQNERLVRLDEMKDEFVATASHELRTPLAAIYGAALTLRSRSDDLTTADARTLLRLISDQAERLARIIEAILSASHLDSGRLRLATVELDAVEVAREVVERARLQLASPQALAVVANGDVPHVRADREKLGQVLTNLVDNAVKYSPPGGAIEVRLERAGDWVRFAVRDEGIGIRAEDQQRVFEKFSRVDPDMAGGVGGTGLGLYICREIVRLHGGRIWVWSAEGEGATFFVELPAVADLATATDDTVFAIRGAA